MGFFELFAAGLAGIYALIPSYGVAIILLTVLVRLLLLPLSIKQTRSMREMQRIAPEVAKLKSKHKGDRQKLNEETMKLYKEHGVNPAGGCLPLLMQFPVFIALYNVISKPLEYMGYCASATGDCADVDKSPPIEWVVEQGASTVAAVRESALAQGLLDIPLAIHRFLAVFRLDCSPGQVFRGEPSAIASEACGSGVVSLIPYVLLIAAMGFTTYYQSKQMQAKQPAGAQDAMAQQAQMMGRIMPIVLMVFSFQFPAGLTLYWLTSNVWTIGQQRLMLRVAPPVVHGENPDKNGKNGRGAKAAQTSAEAAPVAAKGAPANGGSNKARSKAKAEATRNKRKKR